MGTSPSTAKNSVKRCLWGIACPSPSKKLKDKIWEFFDSRCAYCDEVLHREKRGGHIDHLMPVASLRHTLRGDFVLACPSCNGNGKREMDWESFLRETCGYNEAEFSKRHVKINQWLQFAQRPDGEVSPEMALAIDDAVQEINSTMDRHVSVLRALKKRL